MEVFSGVEMIPSINVSQSVLGDAYPQGGGSWNPVCNKLRFELGSTQAEAVRLQFYKKFKFS